MAATTIHGDEIIAGLKSTIGATAGIVAKWEAYPLPWPGIDKLPMAFFHMSNFGQQRGGKHYNQTYLCEIYYVTNLEVNSSEPEKYCRQQAELIVDQIMNNLNLSLGGNYNALVSGFTPENEVTLFFRNEGQRRICYRIDVAVDVYEDGS